MMTSIRMIFAAANVLILFLSLPTAFALRGSKPKAEGSLQVDDAVDDAVAEDADMLAPRRLQEEMPCVDFDSLPRSTTHNALTDEVCMNNNCTGGCCRSYYWLICDQESSFPNIPCVCNAITKDPTEFVNDTSTPPSISANTNEVVVINPVENGTLAVNNTNEFSFEEPPASFGDEGWFNLEDEMVISSANAALPTPQPSMQPSELPSAAPVIPTPHPTIAPDACQDGSPYGDHPGFAPYTSCQTSLDCIGVGTVSRASDVNDNDGGRRLKKDKEKDSNDYGEDAEGAILGAQQTPPVFCCLASMCLCGSPQGDWHGKCVPPYIIPELTALPTETVTTSAPSQRPTPVPVASPAPVTAAPNTPRPTIPANNVLPAESAPLTPVPTLPTSTTNATSNSNVTAVSNTTVAPVEPVYNGPATNCSGGSWYHDDPLFAGFRKCVTSSECQQVAADECCLKEFCFCGRVVDDDKSSCI